MKSILAVSILVLLTSVVSFARDPLITYSNGEIAVHGKRYNKQVFIDQNGASKQITSFRRWEEIDELVLSRDEKLLLIHHKRDGERAFRLSVMDMDSLKITATTVPGYAGSSYWTKDNNILLKWGCGSPCCQFRLYDSKLNQIAEAGAGYVNIFFDENIIVAPPPICQDDEFRIWSLKDLRLILKKSFKDKYGYHLCDTVIASEGKLTVKLNLYDCAKEGTMMKDSTVTDTIEY